MHLAVRNLSLEIPTPVGAAAILDSVSFELKQGARLGIVGESGSGKSMTAFSILGLLPHGATRSGTIIAGDQELTALDDAAMTRIRGNRIAMIFQEPTTALNPVQTIGRQVAEAARLHLGQSRTEAMTVAAHWLERVGLPQQRFPLHLYPHQLSGGQRQRVLIAAALVGKPDILIADEPTTALDATIQLQILRLIDELVREEGLSLIIISHDLGVIAAMADDVLVMNKGRVVEHKAAKALFASPAATYTRMLLDACPDLHVGPTPGNRYRPSAQGTAPPILEIDALHCRYRRPGSLPLAPGRYNEAVSDVSVALQTGESLGIVGESGSGKSTLAKAIAGLVRPWRGSIRFKGERIDGLSPKARLIARLPINMIFQDPMGSLNPRHTILQSITEPLHLRSLSPQERLDAAVKALRAVKLDDDALARYPHQFSGGQRQRIATARALIAEPELVIADEPVAALDVSIQAQIIDLLNELRERLNLTLLFISHDLAVVRHTTDRTIVMAESRIVETGPTEQLFTNPKADYTRKLLEAVLPADPDLARARIGKN